MIGFGSTQEIFPVLDENRHLTGVVYLEKLLPVMFDVKLAGTLVVFDLMENPRGDLTMDSDLSEAMKYMERFKLEHLPVKGKNGEFIGFVSRAAVFKLYRSVVRDADRY